MELQGVFALAEILGVTSTAPRQASSVFLLVSVFALATSLIPGAVGYHSDATLVVSLLAMLAGVLARTSWAQRLTGYRSLIWAVVGLGLVAASNGIGVVPPIPLGIYFVVIFMWIGQWFPPGVALRFAPLGVAAYLLPFAFGAPHSSGAVPSVLLVIPISVLAGEALARQTAAARRAQRDQAEALATLARASHTDDLTGLGNRRLGNQLFDGLQPGDVVAILDLDDFKQVNDVYGHARGDQVLQQLGAFLLAEVREADTVARMGGEEFMLVVRPPDAVNAERIVGRLLEQWRVTTPLSTLSAGIATHAARQSPSSTYSKADAALYEAKNAGRDRLVVSAA